MCLGWLSRKKFPGGSQAGNWWLPRGIIFSYDISGQDALKAGEWRSVHGGYDPAYAAEEPMLAMPLDALRRLEKEGKIGYLHPWFYTTTGNQTNRETLFE